MRLRTKCDHCEDGGWVDVAGLLVISSCHRRESQWQCAFPSRLGDVPEDAADLMVRN
jgi:hypothetical protein